MKFVNEKVTQDTTLPNTDTLFLLTDTMASRKEIGRAHLLRYKFLIETRMASSYGNINAIELNQESTEEWFASLSDDETTEVSPCGSTISVGPTASVIANMAVWQYMHHINDPLAIEPNVSLFLHPLTIGFGQ